MLEKFSKKKSPADIGETIPNLSVDMNEVLMNGRVTGGLEVVSYENLSSPNEVGSYIRDNIDALQIAKDLNQSIAGRRASAKAKAEESKATEKVAPEA